ncbi:PadR family transcriptional regulator [Candidatus Bathyarchaeota archaeon]|nr:MAG: PadR family transcriptional regulator [Candidatus Bathyarchaeota archaeon]
MVALTIAINGEKSEARIIKKMHERVIKTFMDTIILAELQNGSISGYDVISFIHNKFGFLASSGTVYSLLYSLERNDLWSKESGLNEKESINLPKKAQKLSRPLLIRMIKSRGSCQQSLKHKHPCNSFFLSLIQ